MTLDQIDDLLDVEMEKWFRLPLRKASDDDLAEFDRLFLMPLTHPDNASPDRLLCLSLHELDMKSRNR